MHFDFRPSRFVSILINPEKFALKQYETQAWASTGRTVKLFQPSGLPGLLRAGHENILLPCINLVQRAIRRLLNPVSTYYVEPLATLHLLEIPAPIQIKLAQRIAEHVLENSEKLKGAENEEIQDTVVSPPPGISSPYRNASLYRFGDPVVERLVERCRMSGKASLGEDDLNYLFEALKPFMPQIEDHALVLVDEGVNRITALAIAVEEFLTVAIVILEGYVRLRIKGKNTLRDFWARICVAAVTAFGCISSYITADGPSGFEKSGYTVYRQGLDAYGHLKIYIDGHTVTELIRAGEKTGRTVGKYPFNDVFENHTAFKSHEVNKCELGSKLVEYSKGNTPKLQSSDTNIEWEASIRSESALIEAELYVSAVTSLGEGNKCAAASVLAAPHMSIGKSTAGSIAAKGLNSAATLIYGSRASLVSDRGWYKQWKYKLESIPSVSFALGKEEYQQVSDYLDDSIENCRLEKPSCNYDGLTDNCVDFAQSVFSQTNYTGHFVGYMDHPVDIRHVARLYGVFRGVPGLADTFLRGSTVMLALCLGKPLWGIAKSTVNCAGRLLGWKRVNKASIPKKFLPGRLKIMRKIARQKSKELNGYLNHRMAQGKGSSVIDSEKVIDGDLHLDESESLRNTSACSEEQVKELQKSLRCYNLARK